MANHRKVYLEITNVCNLRCAFCPGTTRPPHSLTEAEFSVLLDRVAPWAEYLYYHLMGEPTAHPLLPRFMEMAAERGLKSMITTNGTLLPTRGEAILTAHPHKVNISLHAFEANDLTMPFADYLTGCFAFGRAVEGQKLISYRLWNQGGQDEKNDEILQVLEEHFPKPWAQERHGLRIGNRVYLEYGDKFDWPDLTAPDGGCGVFCHGLRDQIGVLCDGTVVPCCLDHEGDIALGSLFRQQMDEILDSPRARALYNGFSQRKATEELCRRCGYARRFG